MDSVAFRVLGKLTGSWVSVREKERLTARLRTPCVGLSCKVSAGDLPECGAGKVSLGPGERDGTQ